MVVLILSGFKTGTHALAHALEQSGVPVLRSHLKLPETPPTHVVTMVRGIADQAISAFFQDITSEGYAYRFGTQREVLDATVEELFTHFSRFDWTSYPYLRYQDTWAQIEAAYGVHLKSSRGLPQRHLGHPSVLAVSIDSSNETLSKLLSDFVDTKVNVLPVHCGESKW